ncbi:Uncharacterized protein TCM_028516 [Theobroma cacao]|uniref:Uncharacterized protein n=1 Tax=Theobroma cacao TaxID=3641 RepID=A0A061GBX2_THECC|nr:Uncharacterized protein TCM_028516 [Theobroma cacao]
MGYRRMARQIEKSKAKSFTTKEGSILKHTGGSVPFVVHAKKMIIEMKRDVSFLEVFNRTHKHLGGHGDFIDNKSKSTSLQFDPNAWTEAIEGIEITRTVVYRFGTRVPTTALLTRTHNNVATFESTCGPMPSNTTSPVIALEEKVENLSKNLGKIRDELRGEICEEIKNAMAESMSEFMARMESMIMTNALSKQGNAGP